MIELRTSGDMFASGADALVNPVNCVGTAGAGLAKEFRWRYPRAHKEYAQLCDDKIMCPGVVMFNQDDGGPKIVWLVTKRHWRDNSRLEDVDNGLKALADWLTVIVGVRTIAVPALGCGLGGLDWDVVYPLMKRHLGGLETVAYVYGPRVATKRGRR